MTKLEIENIHRQATLFLDNAEVSEAFETVGKLSHELSRADINDELERLHMSYMFMLKYLEQGVMDPQRDEILSKILQSLYSLNDQCFIGLMEQTSPEVFYARRRELAGVSLISIIE